jgi:hypothetical protein
VFGSLNQGAVDAFLHGLVAFARALLTGPIRHELCVSGRFQVEIPVNGSFQIEHGVSGTFQTVLTVRGTVEEC